MKDFSEELTVLRERLENARGYLKIGELRGRRPQLETEASRPDLWDDPEKAKAVTGELASVIDDLELYDGLVGRLEDAETLAEMARDEGDESLEPEIDEGVGSLSATLDELELRALFTGEHDEGDAVVEAIEADRDAGVALACELVEQIGATGIFDGIHLIPVSRYRDIARRLEP